MNPSRVLMGSCQRFTTRIEAEVYGTIKQSGPSLLYLPPVASLDGVPGYHHHRPERGQRLPQAFVVLPVGTQRAAVAAAASETELHLRLLSRFSTDLL